MDFAKLRHIIFFALLVISTIFFLYMVAPFAYPIFWAAIIAGVFYPLYRTIKGKTKSPNFSAAITLVIAVIVIIIPLASFATLIVGESLQVFSDLENNGTNVGEALQNTFKWVKTTLSVPGLDFNEQFWADKFAEASREVTTVVFTSAKAVTQNSLSFIVKLVLMLYTLFFFLRDGEAWLKTLMRLCPLGDKYEKRLYQKFVTTTSATLKGTVVIGGLQGLLGALLFMATGVEGALIWGLLLAVSSVIPAFGTGLIWAPIGLYMLFTGAIWQGVLILVVGVSVISTVDNFIRPILIGQHTKMHPIIILFSTLGGIILFGVSGLVIGPVISSLFITFWQMYDEYYQDELKNNNANGL
ncbi:MAG: AI-2E family transporter [bacterium]|nr:AI-2E family transporter [bacterium]